MAWLYLSVAVLFEVAATSALKASESFTRLGPSVIVIIGYAVSFYLMTIALQKLPLGIVYAVWSASGIVLIAIIGAVRYGERLDLPATIGMALIVAGVLTINLLSKSEAH